VPILDSETLEIFSRSADQTRRFGMRLGRMLQNGDILCFSGDLGSGKTTFIQGIAQGWGSVDQVTSPTFVLVNEYYRMDGSTLFHMDAYRIDSTLEAEELDIDRMLHQGVLVVEWAERIDSILPKERLTIKMAWVADEQRSLVMVPYGERYQTLLHSFRHRSFGV
jgi:tRNA threonylcarbamoyladenosine biosynthesis protein TsaE